jgi:Glycoside-hydrolase family GH114
VAINRSVLRYVTRIGCVTVLSSAIVASATAPAPGGPHEPRARATAYWSPAPGTTWQWQITGKVTEPFLNVAMYDIDLQDAVPARTVVHVPGFRPVTWPRGLNAGVIGRLHAVGKKVICYLDTGAWESYRPDAHLFPGWRHAGKPRSDADVVLNPTSRTGGQHWPGEFWLDIRAKQRHRFASIIWARLGLAKQIGCDGVEPDQNNPVGNNPGRNITYSDEKSWYLEVASQAHAHGLSVGMKNGVEVIDAQMVRQFDWSLNEECFYFTECNTEQPFIRAGKAVFQAEYTDDWKTAGLNTPAKVARKVCPKSRRLSFSTLIKNIEPDTLFVPCLTR